LSVSSPSRIVRFSTFEVNLQTGELRKQGHRLKLQEQPFQVLAALLERPGELVTREELRSKLWPAETFVDFDHGLNAAIKRLRDALGESADTPMFIETMARRGYRFVAPVNGCSVPDRIGVAAAHVRTKSSFVRLWVAVALLSPIVIGAAVWAIWRFLFRPTEAIERKLTANSWENPVSSAAVSPDGKYIAYADNTGIYLKLIRTGETHSMPLPPNFSAWVDSWSPDGAHLLVTRKEQPGKPSLWSISVFGGSPRKLAEDAAGGSLSPDGSHIAFLRADISYDNYDLLYGREEWVMRSDGTDQLKAASQSADTSVGAPSWSPDGKRIAYVRTNQGWARGTSSVELNDWRNAHAERLFSDRRLGAALLWRSDGRIAYALDEDDPPNHQNSSVWMVSPHQSLNDPTLAVHLTQGTGEISQFTESADGRVLVLRRSDWQSTVYIGTMAADGASLLATRRLTLEDSEAYPFSWTPDSKAVLFSSNRNGTFAIFIQEINQPLAENLATGPDLLMQARLTPDGSEILFISVPKFPGPENPSSIFAIPIRGGTPRLVLKDIGIWNVQCARLPSTTCLYGIGKGRTTETFRFDVRSGKSAAPPQIDPECSWSLSPDGSQRAVLLDDQEILLRSTSTGETRKLAVKGWFGLAGVDWSADGKSLLIPWRNYEGENGLLKVALDGRVSVLLRSKSSDIGWAIPSPDGNHLAINERLRTGNVWAVENFR
jgi:DNA-binding winged helix-turn-helix (wHTH) protein/Tol biopolymer transport system component